MFYMSNYDTIWLCLLFWTEVLEVKDGNLLICEPPTVLDRIDSINIYWIVLNPQRTLILESQGEQRSAGSDLHQRSNGMKLKERSYWIDSCVVLSDLGDQFYWHSCHIAVDWGVDQHLYQASILGHSIHSFFKLLSSRSPNKLWWLIPL
jgi:hypothetical protein